MLIGEYEHSLDVKGRLIMPAKLRQDIGDKFVITKGLDGCLFAFSQEEWLNFETKLKSLPLSDRNARNFVRFLFALLLLLYCQQFLYLIIHNII